MSELEEWIALSMVPDVGPAGARRLVAAFGAPMKVFAARHDELTAVEGIGANKAASIRAFSLWRDVEKTMRSMERSGVAAVHYGEPDYPGMLRETNDAPIVLYTKGKFHPDDRFSIAIVGSRNASHYGSSVAERISEDLSSVGFTVVSGLARGIDSHAHRGALKAGGRTVAVLGSGPDVPYPPENKALIERIAQSGCVVSEFPPGTPPEKENFPRRNRVISGLSMGVIVVEAAKDSGALITARYALEQGREVFAVPGPITSSLSAGSNSLIRNGAVLVRRAEDIVEELAPVLKGFIRPRDKVKIEVTGEERIICDLLTGEPKQIDMISRESGIPASKALSTLLGLELKGVVRQITGKRFYLS